LIKLGLLVLSPKLFYAAACLLCAVVAISIGSSWTTAASIGIALVGIAKVFGLSVEITAGAVISGAYFGDKMSPLSDTTNLASAVAEVDLFAHVKHMAWTGVPALLLSLFVFTVLGLQQSAAVDTTSLQNALLILEKNYQLSGWLLLPLIVLMTLAYKQVPAFPSLVFGAFVGAIVAVIFQPQLFQANSSALTQLWLVAIDGYEAKTGDSLLDELLSGGGAVGMLNTIWLIVSAIFFGCAMEISSFLSVLIKVVLKIVHGTASLIAVTVGTGVLANIVTCEQYLAILLPGRMYRQAYLERGLDTLNLSRALEDSATVTSPLVPWNTCGAFMAATLGVATLDYMAFSFFNLFMPLLSIAYGLVGFKMRLIQCSPDAA
jgi:NhaC family Na+:H+ antiporter